MGHGEAHVGEEARLAALADQRLGADVRLSPADAAGVDAEPGRLLDDRVGEPVWIHAPYSVVAERAPGRVSDRAQFRVPAKEGPECTTA